MKRCLALVFLSLASIGPLAAADVYRWVDEKGKTQFSDKVPEKFKSSATKVKSRITEGSAENRREAESRAAKDRDAEAARQSRARASEQAASTADKPGSKAPGTAADCASLRRSYQQSQECIAPFRNANGSLRAEATEKCGAALPDPSSQCGAPTR